MFTPIFEWISLIILLQIRMIEMTETIIIII